MTTPTPHGAPELLPCPFCGCVAEMQNNFGQEWWAQCEGCDATHGVLAAFRNEAADIWNRRAAIQQAAGAVPEGRSDKDYAIEHAEYMAKDGERLIDAVHDPERLPQTLNTLRGSTKALELTILALLPGRMVMDDRELLEWAAKAAGIDVIRSRLDDPLNFDMLIYKSARNIGQLSGAWNPLTDDGDALRLTVKLKLWIRYRDDGSVNACWYDERGFFAGNTTEKFGSPHNGGDQNAAARRCITRAAAEIGKATASAGEGGQ